MKVDEWLALFRKQSGSKILHFEHLRLLTDMQSSSLRMALSRLAERKVIQRICRGFYTNPFNPPSLEETAAVIYRPSYISLESVLSRYGIMSQIPQRLTCVTTRLPRFFKTSLGAVEYRQVKKRYFFGFLKKDGYWMAEPEKAFLDFVYLNRGKEIRSLLEEFDRRTLNRRRVRDYAQRMNLSLPE